MILIFNGMLGTNIDNISRHVSTMLNKKINDFDVEVDNDNNTELSILHNNENISLEEYIGLFESTESDEVIEKINKLKHLEDSQSTISLGTNFLYSYYYDVGMDTREEFLSEFPDFKVSKALDIKDYSPTIVRELVEKYNLEYFVISGQIGKNYIDEIIKEFGEENVKVYNIKRHPVISHKCFKLMKRYNDSYYKTFLYHLDLLNTELLEKQDYITTYKFEDLLEKDSIQIDGKEVKLPKKYVGDYKYISEFEAADKFFMDTISKMENFEEIYTNEDLSYIENMRDIISCEEVNYDPYIMYPKIFNSELNKETSTLYKNFVRDLGYPYLKIEDLLN